MLITDLPFRTSGPVAEVTPNGTPYDRLYINETGDETVLLTVPNAALDRDEITLVIGCHGYGGSFNSFNDHPPFLELRDMCTDEEWVFAAPNMHGNQWGNQVAMDDVRRISDYVGAAWPTVHVILAGGSMGALTVLNALARNVLPNVLGAVTVAGVVDLGVVHSISSYQPSVRAAYGVASDGSDFATKTAGFDPILRPGAAWTRHNIDMYHSPDDTAITMVAHPLAWEATGRPGSARWFRLTATAGAHLAAGNFDNLQAVAFMRRAVAGSLPPRASVSVALDTVTVFDDTGWVEGRPKVQAVRGGWVAVPATAYLP